VYYFAVYVTYSPYHMEIFSRNLKLAVNIPVQNFPCKIRSSDLMRMILGLDTSAKPSLFKVKDEWLALPEVFSKLDFNANNTFAHDNDLAGQMKLR
jgi:hypothetical protein